MGIAGTGEWNFQNTGGVSIAREVIGADAGAGGAATAARAILAKAAIPDNTATAILTVTVPNAINAASIELTLLSSNGADRPYESTRVAKGLVVLTRIAGAAVVAVATALAQAGIATSAAGATHTLAYSVSAPTGAVGAINTFTINVTIVGTGGTPASHNLVAVYTLVNAVASGVTIASV